MYMTDLPGFDLQMGRVIDDTQVRSASPRLPAMPKAKADLSSWDDVLGFFAKQQEALEAIYQYRFVLYGGARGGGKSRFLRWAAVDFLVALHEDLGLKNVTVGLFCETYPDLRDRQITKIAVEFPEWIGKLSDTKENGLSFKLSEELGGGVIVLRNLDDPTKYQSAEFAGIFVDELTKTQLDTFNILRGSLRWPGVKHTVFVGATNPGGIGHAWVKSYWIDKVFPPEMKLIKDQFYFVQSLPSDNPTLDETYWNDLNSLTPELQRAWVKGDWDIFSGMAFPSWSEKHICSDFEIPSYWTRLFGMDWGYSKPFAALWGAQDPDSGRIYLYREAYAAGLSDLQQAKLVLQYTGEELIRSYFADPSMWTKRNQMGIATSTADVFHSVGINLTPGNNDRIGGKRKIDRLLMNLPDGRPGVMVFKSMKQFLRTFPLLAYDKHNVEDVDTSQEDHLFDAFKYLLTPIGNIDVKKKTANSNKRKGGLYALRNAGLV